VVLPSVEWHTSMVVLQQTVRPYQIILCFSDYFALKNDPAGQKKKKMTCVL